MEVRKLLQNLTANTRYTVRVRAINEFGVFSPWSEALDFTTGNDTSQPAPPTGLTLDFHTPSLVANWDPVQLNVDGTSLLDLRAYEVSFTVAGVSRVHDTNSPYFVLPFAQNRVDFGSAQPEILVSVRAVDVAGNRSGALTGVATNDIPPTPVDPPVAVTGFTVINVTIPAQADVADLDGFDIYHSTTPAIESFGLLVSTANGVDTYAHAVGQGTTHYYRYKTRDVFGQTSPDFSPMATTTTFSALIEDTEPPADIANFHVLSVGLDADQRAFIELGWDFSSATDLASYEIRYRRTGDSVFSSVLVGVDTTTYRFGNLVAGAEYRFQIRAFDISSNVSGWVPTDELVVTTVVDEEAPAAPAGLVITPGIRTLILQWDANTEFDFDHYDVHVATDAGFVPSAANLYSSPGPGTVESVAKAWDGSDWVELIAGHTYYIRTFAYDRSGNKSDPSVEVSATTRFVTVADIAAESITADRIATSTLLAALTISGSIKTATSGARMELNSSGLVGYANDGTTEHLRYKNADSGLIVDNAGYIMSSNYVAGVSGWYLGAGSGSGVLEVNEGVIKGKALQIGVSSENLVVNSSFENYPAAGADVGLAREWGEYPFNGRSPLVHTWTPGTGSDVAGPNFLYQSRSQKLTIVGALTTAGLMQLIDLSTTPVAAGTSVTASVWIKMGSGVGSRLARVALKNVTSNKTYTVPNAQVLADGGWHRVVVTAFLTQPAEQLEIHCYVGTSSGPLSAGEIFFFEGAQLELSAYVSSYHPATLEIPDNYIQSAYISGLTADRIKAGVISSELIQINGTGFIQSFGYSESSGSEAGYRLSVDGITFQNGAIDINGAGGVVHLDGDGLRAEYGGVPQLNVDSSGIFIGGSSAVTADLYVDTANDRTVFQSSQGSYSFVVDTKPDPGENKALRLYETASGIDSFYLTYAGLGYFAKGVIGTAGAGGNRVHNASFETTKGTASLGTGGLDYWFSYSTGSGTVTVSQAGTATALPLHGGFSSQLTWSTNTGRKGIQQAPAVSMLNGPSVWAATSVWTLSFGVAHLGVPQLPQVGFDMAGITVTPVLTPPAAAAWQQYVYRITVDASNRTDNFRIYFTGPTGNVVIDAVQLERGEVSSSFNLMPEEMQWAVAPPMGIGDTIQSTNYVTNVSGWKISGDGNTEFNNISMRGTLISGDVEVGNDVGPGGGHYGISLSSSNFNNIFLRRSDGHVFFRVNEGGANSLTFDTIGNTLTVRGTITSSAINSSAINTPTISGGSISGTTINVGNGAFSVDGAGITYIDNLARTIYRSPGSPVYTIEGSGSSIRFSRSDFGANLHLDLNIGFTINTWGPDIMHCYRIAATGAAPFTFVDNSRCGFRFWSSTVGGGMGRSMLTITNDGITRAENNHYQNTTDEQGFQSMREGLVDVGYCWHQAGHRAVRMTLGTNGVMYVRNNLDGAVTFDGIASRLEDKRDLQDLEKQRTKLKRIKAKRFKYKIPTESKDFQRSLERVAKGKLDPETHAKQMAQFDREQVGFVAEEMAEVFPEVVAYDDNGVPWGIRYQMLVPVLWELIQDLEERLGQMEKNTK